MRGLFATLILLAAASLPARAETACDTPRNGFDGIYCLSKVYQQADQDLNTNFGRLHERLDAPGQGALRTGQLAWLRSRDTECSRHEGSGFFVDLACATRVTIDRNRFLEDRYRECVSSGCLDRRLMTQE